MSKKRKSNKSFKGWFILGYIFSSMLTIVGCFLIGFGYGSFVEYEIAKSYVPNFLELLSTWNAYVDSADWTYIGIEMFACGVSALIFGILTIILLVFFHLKKNKKNPSDVKDIKVVSKNQKEKNKKRKSN